MSGVGRVGACARRGPLVWVVATLMLCARAASAQPSTPADGTLVRVIVQGAMLTDEAEVRARSGLLVGQHVDAATLAEARAALTAWHAFARVEVHLRYASLSDPGLVLAVVTIDEGPVRVERAVSGASRVRHRGRLSRLQWMPMAGTGDGEAPWGGVALSWRRAQAAPVTVSVPIRAGGRMQAGVRVSRPIGRSRTVVAFAADQLRDTPRALGTTRRIRTLSLVAEQPVRDRWQARAWLTREWGRGNDRADAVTRAGGDVVRDGRQDPWLPGRATVVRLLVERVSLPARQLSSVPDRVHAWHTVADLQSAVGIGRSSLVFRVVHDATRAPLPAWQQLFPGRADTLRGAAIAGLGVGDTLTAGSVDLRVPVQSPRQRVRFGVRGGVEVVAAYAAGRSARGQPFVRADSAGLWAQVGPGHVGVDVVRVAARMTRLVVVGALPY